MTKFKISKEARISIAIGIFLTLIVLLIVIKSNHRHDFTYFRRNPCSQDDDFGDRNTVKSTVNSQKTEKRDKFLKNLQELKNKYESRIYHAPPKHLQILLKTSALDAEAFLLDVFSPALHSFYVECVKAIRVYEILNSSDQLSKEMSTLLFEALDKDPPDDIKMIIQKRVNGIYNPFEELFTFLRVNPGKSLEEWPQKFQDMLFDCAKFEDLRCPADLETALRSLYFEAQKRKPK